MTRWKASGLHLLISAGVVGSVVAFLLLTWYPPAYVRMGKLGGLIGLVAGIDLVLGPLLTLIVFRQGKRHLKLDLAIIGLLQVSAMGYGLNVMWQSRPVFLVAVHDRLELVYANEIDPASLAEAKNPAHRTLSISGPLLIGARVPVFGTEVLEVTLSAAQGRDVQTLPKYYIEYDQAAEVLVSHGFTLQQGDQTPPWLSDRLARAARDFREDPASLRWVPITSRRGSASVMLIRWPSGDMVGAVDVDPWAGAP